eukprot:scaffold9984_cov148-Skeletonema_dohrnii-CCMP3373.AAC.22
MEMSNDVNGHGYSKKKQSPRKGVEEEPGTGVGEDEDEDKNEGESNNDVGIIKRRLPLRCVKRI